MATIIRMRECTIGEGAGNAEVFGTARQGVAGDV